MTLHHFVVPLPGQSESDREQIRQTSDLVDAYLAQAHTAGLDPGVASLTIHLLADQLELSASSRFAWDELVVAPFFEALQLCTHGGHFDPITALLITATVDGFYGWLHATHRIDAATRSRVASEVETARNAFVGRSFITFAEAAAAAELEEQRARVGRRKWRPTSRKRRAN